MKILFGRHTDDNQINDKDTWIWTFNNPIITHTVYCIQFCLVPYINGTLEVSEYLCGICVYANYSNIHIQAIHNNDCTEQQCMMNSSQHGRTLGSWMVINVSHNG